MPVIMPDHHDPIVKKTFLKQNMIRKPFEIAPPSPAWVVVVSLRRPLDALNRIVNLLPELVTQFIRYLRIHSGNIASILCSSGMD